MQSSKMIILRDLKSLKTQVNESESILMEDKAPWLEEKTEELKKIILCILDFCKLFNS